MATRDDTAFSDMFRSNPVQSAMVSLVPLLLALAQLANGYFNDMSIFVSISFAIVVVLFAVLLTQHQYARFRRQYAERNLTV